MARSDTELSKAVSHALRHDPSSYGLALDSEGWVKIQDLVAALGNRHSDWENLDEERLQEMIDRSSKRRHEILNGKIRAIYGHSTPDRVVKQAAVPPELLYHGTASDVADKILSEGLKPMTRQYVHLSLDLHTAREVGARKDSHPVILQVRAADASRRGVVFYEGNESVWLADYVPGAFISKVTGK